MGNLSRKALTAIIVMGILIVGAVTTVPLMVWVHDGNTPISEGQAKKIAYEHSQVNIMYVEHVIVKLNREMFQKNYDVKFYAENIKYDYEIDAKTGKINEADIERESYNDKSAISSNETAPTLSKKEAINKVLVKVPGAKISNVYKIEFDYEYGRLVYEGKIVYNYVEYEFEIDAVTGEITDWSVSHNEY